MPILKGEFGKADNRDMKKFFGLDPKAKWPDEGMAPIVVQGITIGVAPRQPGHFFIREWAICPCCHRTFAASRLDQHLRTHENLKPAIFG